MSKEKIEFIDWHQIKSLVKIIVNKIKASGNTSNLITGLSPGGLVISRMLLDYFNNKKFVYLNLKNLENLTYKIIEDYFSMLDYDKKLLIVDDIDKDTKLETAFNFFKKISCEGTTTLTLIHMEKSNFQPDYYAKSTSQEFVLFPWNL